MPFQIGPLELVIILAIALIIIGPGRLPEVGSALGKSIREFRKAATDVQDAAKIDTGTKPPAVPPTSSAAAVVTGTAAAAAQTAEPVAAPGPISHDQAAAAQAPAPATEAPASAPVEPVPDAAVVSPEAGQPASEAAPSELPADRPA